MSVTDEIKQRVDLVDLVSESVSLRKAGRNFKGLCPFHQEKTPSFVVFPETQGWHCFGACGEGGDVFSFVQKHEGVDFGEALGILARRAGISLDPQTPEMIQEEEQRDRLLEVLEAATAFFQERLASPEGEPAQTYLAGRGMSSEASADFRLGYSPNSWRALITRLTAIGYTREELIDSGLASQSDEGRVFDRFRHRLMFPIDDARGRIVGFGARTLDGSPPKYLNSPETRLFDKSRLLYALSKARQAIRAESTVVIVEGYMDAIAAHECGYGNVVASMGTAIGEPHLRSLTRLAGRFVLALDPDAAGNAATLRGLDVAREALQGDAAPVYEGGLLRFESRLEAEIRVAVLPDGLDPDEIIRRNPSEWERLIAEARSVVEYNFDVALAETDLSDAKDKARLARRLLPVIASVSDPVERAHYVEKLARQVQVDPRVVEQELATMRDPRGSRRAPEPGPEPVEGTFGVEEYALTFLLRSADALAAANAALAAAGLEPLAGGDFLDPANRSLFDALAGAETKDRLAFRSSLGSGLRQRFDFVERRWARSPEVDESALRQDGVTACLRLRERRLRNEMHLLQLAIEGSDDEEEKRGYQNAIGRSSRQVFFMSKALADRSSLRVKE